MLKTYFCVVASLLFMVPSLLGSQTALASGASPAPGTGVVTKGIQFKNPLKAQTITELLEGILAIVLVLAIPLLIFFIIYAGFKYVTARGNPAKLETAHKALGYAILGGVLVIGAFAIGTIIQNLVNAFK